MLAKATPEDPLFAMKAKRHSFFYFYHFCKSYFQNLSYFEMAKRLPFHTKSAVYVYLEKKSKIFWPSMKKFFHKKTFVSAQYNA